MANSDKNIIITPNISSTTADPKIAYSGANATVGAQTVTMYVYPDNSGTLSWEGSAGQLLSVTNTLTGTIFAVNDVSGIPSITVLDTGQVTLAPFVGNLVIGNVTDANTAKVQITGTVSATGNITAPFFIGNGSALTGITVSGGSSIINGTSNVVVAASGNVTVGVAGTAAVTTFATTGIFVPGLASVTGTTTSGGYISQTQASNVMSRMSLVNSVRNWSISNYGNQFGPNGSFNIADETGGTVRLQITTAGIVAITGSLTVSTGNITGGNIVNANANGVGNIGSATGYFNTVFAKATSAQYADLAEIYTADNIYESGTVVIFGGDEEITVTTEMADERVAGAISTNPAYLMNTGQTGLPVALRGRVPVNVIGPVEKGDSLVTANVAGYAVSVGRDRSYAQSVFAKALETNKEIGTKVITAVIL